MSAPNVQIDIDEKTIERFVDEHILSDPELNTIVPDKIERKVYARLFHKALLLGATVLGGVRVEFMGHEATIVVKPLKQ